MEPSITVIVLVSAGILGFGIKYFFHACDDNDMSEQIIFIQNTEAPEIPPSYEYDNPPPYSSQIDNNQNANYNNDNTQNNSNQFYNGD